MKFILLAAAAIIALPTTAVAQESPQTAPPTTAADPATAPATAPDHTTPPDITGQPATPPDPSAPAPMTTQARPGTPPTQTTGDTTQQSTPPTATSGGMATETAGGYQPSQPAISGGTPQPGAIVRFQPAPSPDQAYPAPAAKENYPVCKKGQYDGCIQASDARGSRAARRRR